MSMMDLQGAIGGPPGGAPPSISIPGGGPGADPNAAPTPADTGPQPSDGGSSVDFLDSAEEAMHQYIQIEPDEVDRAAGATILQSIIKLKAKDQKDRQSGNMSSLARALTGNGAGPGGQGGPVGP